MSARLQTARAGIRCAAVQPPRSPSGLWFGGQDTLDLLDSPHMGITHVLVSASASHQAPRPKHAAPAA